jgi:hypothetical protein
MGMTKRWIGTALAGILASSLLAMGCGSGDDDGGGDAACGHCPKGAFELQEGGELRIELIQSGGADGELVENAGIQGFFHHNQVGERPLSGPALTNAAGMICQDFRAYNLFDNGTTEANQAMADTRDYFDVGEEITISDEAGVGKDIVLPKMLNGVDPSSGLQHDILYLVDDAADLERNAFYTMSIPGTEEYPAIDFRNGSSNTGQDWTARGPEIYMPPNFTMTTPAEADYLAGVEFTPGQDFTFKWTNDTGNLSEAPDNTWFVALYNGKEIDFLCLDNDDAAIAGGEGSSILPKEIIDAATDEGGVLLGKFSHIAWNQGIRADARFDMIGTSCKFAPYSKAVAP